MTPPLSGSDEAPKTQSPHQREADEAKGAGPDVSDVSATGRPTACAPKEPALRLGGQLFPSRGHSAGRDETVSPSVGSSAAYEQSNGPSLDAEALQRAIDALRFAVLNRPSVFGRDLLLVERLAERLPSLIESERRVKELEAAVANLHAILNLSPVAADYETRLAALHAARDKAAATPTTATASGPS